VFAFIFSLLFANAFAAENNTMTEEEKAFWGDIDETKETGETEFTNSTDNKPNKDLVQKLGDVSFLSTDKEYKEFVEKKALIISLFEPSLGDKIEEIKKFIPELKAKNIRFGFIDPVTVTSLNDEYPINSPLEVFLFNEKKVVKFYSFPEVTLENLIKFYHCDESPLLTEAKTLSEIDKLRDLPLAVATFSSKNSPEFTHFSELAKLNSQNIAKFVYILLPESEQKQLVQKYVPYASEGHLVVLPLPGLKDYYPLAFDKILDLTDTDMKYLLFASNEPIFPNVSSQLFFKYVKYTKNEAWFYFSEAEYNKYKDELIPLLLPFRHSFTFFWLDDVSNENKQQVKALHLTKTPTLTIVKNGDERQQFFYDKDFSVSIIKSFFQDYLAGKIEPFTYGEILSDEEMKYSVDKIGKLSGKNLDQLNKQGYTHVVSYTIFDYRAENYNKLFVEFFNKHKSSFKNFLFYTLDVSKNQFPSTLTFPGFI